MRILKLNALLTPNQLDPHPDHAPHDGPAYDHFAEVTQPELSSIVLKMNSSTSSLDTIPTSLLKACVTAIVPTATYVINRSLSTGEVPPSLKLAAIKPVLKKHNLDPEDLSNYRPISKLPFLAKILEKVVTLQLHDHLHSHQLYESFQSGFKTSHSTETALVW